MNIKKLTREAKVLQRGLNLSMNKFLQKYDEFGYSKHDFSSALTYFKSNNIVVNFYHSSKRKLKVILKLPNGKTECFAGVTWGHIVRMVHNELNEPELVY